MNLSELRDPTVEEELAELSLLEIAGGYKSLCAGMLLRTAQEICTTSAVTHEGAARKRAARNWLFKKSGLITLAEACEACELRVSDYRDRLLESAENLHKTTKYIAANKRNRFVFGRQINASNDEPSASGSDPS